MFLWPGAQTQPWRFVGAVDGRDKGPLCLPAPPGRSLQDGLSAGSALLSHSLLREGPGIWRFPIDFLVLRAFGEMADYGLCVQLYRQMTLTGLPLSIPPSLTHTHIHTVSHTTFSCTHTLFHTTHTIAHTIADTHAHTHTLSYIPHTHMPTYTHTFSPTLTFSYHTRIMMEISDFLTF